MATALKRPSSSLHIFSVPVSQIIPFSVYSHTLLSHMSAYLQSSSGEIEPTYYLTQELKVLASSVSSCL